MLDKEFRGEISPLERCFSSFLVIGCAISASDGSSPQVYVRLPAVVHRFECNVSSDFLESSMSKELSVECYHLVEEN